MKKILLTIICLLFLEGLKTSAQCSAGYTWLWDPLTAPDLLFIDSSYGAGTLAYFWDFGDGTTDTIQNPGHSYGNGTFNVCLTITDSLGCVDSVCNYFTPHPLYMSAFLFLVDSTSFFNCVAPQQISFVYAISLNTDSLLDSIKIEVDYGDGTDSVFYIPINSFGAQDTLTHQYLNPGNYSAQLIATSPELLTDTINSHSIIISSTCGNISGIVYEDLNGNCLYDSGEEIPDISLNLFSGGQFFKWTSSDSNGVYSFNVPTGANYEIHVSSSNGILGQFNPTCPLSGIITVNTFPSSGNNFGIVCPQGFDLQGSVTCWEIVQGMTGYVCAFVYNQRCNTPITGQIDLTFPTELTPQPDTAGNFYTVNGQVVSYPIDNTHFFWSFCVPVNVSQNVQTGDSVCVNLNIQPIVGDSVPANNTGTFCLRVNASYDPNNKYVTPAGEGVQGLIRPNTDLTYTIRFQNTGNSEAINIFILDTLDANLDEASIEIIGTSHNVNMSLLTGNILRFSYDNIQLADSNTNEPASHGYVTYRIKQKTNLALLSTIRNTASIYFDFNPPIITNTTLNTVDSTLSVSKIDTQSSFVNVYPNPTNGKCYMYFNNTHQKIIYVTDILGKELFKCSTSAENFLLNTENFANGILTVRIFENGINSDSFKLIVSH